MELWVRGRNIDHTKCAWDLLGIYDAEQKAVAACVDENDFVGPAILNKQLPNKDEDAWHGAYYPLAETKENAAKRMNAN